MNMQTKNCTVEVTDHIGLLTVGTSGPVELDTAMCQEINECVTALAADDDAWVVVVAGALDNEWLPKYSQNELQQLFAEIGQSEQNYADDDEIRPMPLDDMMACVAGMKKPTIAAINGMCLGGAYEFALCFDYRIAQSGHYLIGLHEASRGMFPGAGGTQRLTRLLGYNRAFQLIMSAELLPPHRAAHYGTVNEACSGKAVDRAKELASLWIGNCHPLGMANIKELTQMATTESMEDGLRVERNRFMNQLKTWKFGGNPDGK